MKNETIEISLGPARLVLRRLLPWQWRPLAKAHAAQPASLCLELAGLGMLSWRGVAGGSSAEPGPGEWSRLPAAALEPLLAALCPPWPDRQDQAELRALEEYLSYLADFPGLDCSQCREQQNRGEGAPDCGVCPKPSPPDSAEAALFLYPLLRDLPQAAGVLLEDLAGRLGPAQSLRLAGQLAVLQRWSRRLGPRRKRLDPGQAAC